MAAVFSKSYHPIRAGNSSQPLQRVYLQTHPESRNTGAVPRQGNAPLWAEFSLIITAVGLALFTIFHEPPTIPDKATAVAAQPAADSSAQTSAKTETKEDSTALTAASPSPAPAASSGQLPRQVTATHDMSVMMDDGVVGIRQGQTIYLTKKTAWGYEATYDGYLVSVNEGDFR